MIVLDVVKWLGIIVGLVFALGFFGAAAYGIVEYLVLATIAAIRQLVPVTASAARAAWGWEP